MRMASARVQTPSHPLVGQRHCRFFPLVWIHLPLRRRTSTDSSRRAAEKGRKASQRHKRRTKWRRERVRPFSCIPHTPRYSPRKAETPPEAFFPLHPHPHSHGVPPRLRFVTPKRIGKEMRRRNLLFLRHIRITRTTTTVTKKMHQKKRNGNVKDGPKSRSPPPLRLLRRRLLR